MLVAGVGLLFLAGCGAAQTGTPSAHSAPPSPSVSITPSASPSQTPSAAASPSGSASPTAAVSASPSTAASATPTPDLDLSKHSLAGVLSPSGHIACLFADAKGGDVRCDVQGAHWKVATPARCNADYGDSATLGRHRAQLSCHGDTVFGAPHQPTLPYGETVVYRGVTCHSETTGMTCRNQAGHGFMVSKESYRLF